MDTDWWTGGGGGGLMMISDSGERGKKGRRNDSKRRDVLAGFCTILMERRDGNGTRTGRLNPLGLSAISLAFFLFEQGTKATFFLPSFPAPFSNVRHERPHVTATSSPVLSFLLSPSSAGRVFLFLSLFLYSLIPLFRWASSSSPSSCFPDLFRNCNFTAVHCVVMNCGKG